MPPEGLKQIADFVGQPDIRACLSLTIYRTQKADFIRAFHFHVMPHLNTTQVAELLAHMIVETTQTVEDVTRGVCGDDLAKRLAFRALIQGYLTALQNEPPVREDIKQLVIDHGNPEPPTQAIGKPGPEPPPSTPEVPPHRRF